MFNVTVLLFGRRGKLLIDSFEHKRFENNVGINI